MFLRILLNLPCIKTILKKFLVPENIYFAPINYNTGEKTDFSDKNKIIEAFKLKDINNIKNNKLLLNDNYDKLLKFRQFY